MQNAPFLTGLKGSEYTSLYRHFTNLKILGLIYYFPVTIMKIFAEMMLYFHWLRSRRQRVDIFRYSPSSRKRYLCLETQACGRTENESLHLYLQNIYKRLFKSYETIAKWRCVTAKQSHCIVISFFSFNSSISVSRENSKDAVFLW